ncbi:MAG: SRPBCC family protein [Verrucomicrobiota bacterium]|nr:SRPBCC family protein [Verrucomicrobiota bacterium]
MKSDLPPEIHAGMMIRYTVSPLFGIPMTWVTEITHVRKPHYFSDEQRVGPYRLWHHEHSFRAISAEETEVDDLIHYVPPFGPFGAILNQLLVRPQLGRIFDFRTQQLSKIARDAGA